MEEEPLNVDEMEEEEQSSSPSTSTWLERLSGASFYGQCPKHKSKKHNLFCVHCTGKDSVFCELCRSQNDHNEHTIIRVYKASEHPAVRAHAIKSFKNIDVSSIQLYKINSSWIYFINKRPQKGTANSTHSHLQPKCQTCNRDLMPIHQSSGVFRFCSLACKFASDQDGSVRHEEAITSRTRHEPGIGVMNKNKHKHIAPPVHVRKHRRKGIPIRVLTFRKGCSYNGFGQPCIKKNNCRGRNFGCNDWGQEQACVSESMNEPERCSPLLSLKCHPHP